MSEPDKADQFDHTNTEFRSENGGQPRSVESGRSDWLAPPGVAIGTWDYVNRDHIGDQYDAFVKDDPLNQIDRKIISRYLPRLGSSSCDSERESPDGCQTVIDFGCGTGRTLVPLIHAGYRGIGVDLSESMLRNLGENLSSGAAKNAKLTSIRANLVELTCISDHAADHGFCMLSTLGMIKGRTNRARFLAHARRIIRPEGRFFVHAHNYFFQLRHPGGIHWAVKNLWRALKKKEEVGDRLATYRNVSGMFIHQFRRSELRRALIEAGFSSQEWFGIEAGSTAPVPMKRWHNPFRFVGWVVVASS